MSGMDWKLICGGEVTTFGSFESGVGLDRHPSVGSADIVNDDYRRPRSDGIAMGQDFIGSTTVGLDFTVFGSSYDDARARRQNLARAWRGDAVRQYPGALAELVSHTGRTAFGRPRRFAPFDDHLRTGNAQAAADFVMADSNWYGTEQAALVRFIPGSLTGFKFPATFPLVTVGERQTTELIRVTGDSPTPVHIYVQGPIVNPLIQVGPLRFETKVSVPSGGYLEINAWPDERTIRLNGKPAPGVMSGASTRLTEAVLSPGDHEASLRGTSSSGTAALWVRWRDAFASW